MSDAAEVVTPSALCARLAPLDGNRPLCSIALQARLTPRRLPACSGLDARCKLHRCSRAQRACFAVMRPALAAVDRERRSDGARLATASRVTIAVQRQRCVTPGILRSQFVI